MLKSKSSLTFSWRRCLSSFSSLYVRLESTGVLKGFMIFLTATAWPVSWSLAELRETVSVQHSDSDKHLSYQTSPNAPIPTGCKSVYLATFSLDRRRANRQVNKPARDFKGGTEYLGTHELGHLDWIDGSGAVCRWKGGIGGWGIKSTFVGVNTR